MDTDQLATGLGGLIGVLGGLAASQFPSTQRFGIISNVKFGFAGASIGGVLALILFYNIRGPLPSGIWSFPVGAFVGTALIVWFRVQYFGSLADRPIQGGI